MYLVGNLIDASQVAKYTTAQSSGIGLIRASIQFLGNQTKISINTRIAWQIPI